MIHAPENDDGDGGDVGRGATELYEAYPDTLCDEDGE